MSTDSASGKNGDDGFLQTIVKGFEDPDKRSRETLIKEGIKIPPNELNLPAEEPEPQGPRVISLACAQMQVHKSLLGTGVDAIGDLAELLGFPRPPNPTFHWAVLAGDFIHELDYEDPDQVIFYRNKKFDDAYGWRLFPLPMKTDLTDLAISNAGEEVMSKMYPKYNLWRNNCQSFVLSLLKQISKDSIPLLMTGARLVGSDQEVDAAVKVANSYTVKKKLVSVSNSSVPLLETEAKVFEHQEVIEAEVDHTSRKAQPAEEISIDQAIELGAGIMQENTPLL